MKPSMEPSGKLQLLLLLPVLALLLGPPVAGSKAYDKDAIANRHHLEGRRLHFAPEKDEGGLEALETVSLGEEKHVQEASEAPSSIEDQLRQVNGLEAVTDASFQKAFTVEDKVKADEQFSEYKELQDLAARAPLSSPSVPNPGDWQSIQAAMSDIKESTKVSLQVPVHESVGGLEDLYPAVGGASAPGAKTHQAKMSNEDQTPFDHRAQSANAPVALPTDKQAQADGARLLKYSLDNVQLRIFFEEMSKNGGRARVTRAEAVAMDISKKQQAQTNAPVVTDKQAQADAAMLLKHSYDRPRRRSHVAEMITHGGWDRVNRAEAVASKIKNNKGAQADAIMLAKYTNDMTRLYDEMIKNGGSDRVARAEAMIFSVADKTNSKINQADKAPIDHHAQTPPKSSQSDKALIGHHVPPKQGKIDAAAVVSGMPPRSAATAAAVVSAATAPSDLRTHQHIHVPAQHRKDQIDDAMWIKYQHSPTLGSQMDAAMLIKYRNSPRLSSIYFEMRTHGGQARVKRAEAMAEKMQR